MDRRQFIYNAAVLSTGTSMTSLNSTWPSAPNNLQPRSITMWDFSWLERRWPGSGYEDWDRVLDELADRGYNAIRIDAYPHLVGPEAEREYTLVPVWSVQLWGSPEKITVQVQPALNTFLRKCKERDIKVGLSSWYREDTTQARMLIRGPEDMAQNWIKTLRSIADDDLLDVILYVDLCNEWPGDLWCPFFKNDPPDKTWGYWHTPTSLTYMRTAISQVRQAFPELPYCFSFTGGQPALYAQTDLSFFDLLEHHTWMAQINEGEYDKAVGYAYDRFNHDSYQRLSLNHLRVYQERKSYWQKLLLDEIDLVAASARAAQLPLITTECWGIVDFKDWEGLDWSIIKELGELAVQRVCQTGQWLAVATSNFAGPQFAGMWQDVAYHRRLTKMIRGATIHPALQAGKLAKHL